MIIENNHITITSKRTASRLQTALIEYLQNHKDECTDITIESVEAEIRALDHLVKNWDWLIN